MDVPNFHQAFDEIDTAIQKPKKELKNEFWERIPCPQPASNVTVTATSKSFIKKTVTDSKGDFKFTGLPVGDYELSAQASSRSTGIRGVTRMATAKEQFRLGSDINGLKLRLRNDFVTVKGRITDVEGKPIAGAKVTAIEDLDDPSNMHDSATWTTVSSADGSYELQGIEPADWCRLGSLPRGNLHALMHVDIHVEADGFVQDKENVPKVLLVTEEVLNMARRFLKAVSQVVQGAEDSELIDREKKGLTFPSSQGNTITGVDIVLKKAGEGAQ